MDFSVGSQLRALPGPILVTGHTGFKGTWLTLLLERLGIETIGFSLIPEDNSLYNRLNRTSCIPEIIGDIRDETLVSKVFNDHKPSAVIHMAAQPLVLESYKSPVETFQTNVLGTVNILNAAVNQNSVRSVIAVTTDKVYSNQNLGRRFQESDSLMGKDPYSASKVGSEAAISAWQQISELKDGPRIVSVRAGNVIGGGDWSDDRLLPDLIRGFSEGREVTLRNPSNSRPWQHALDPLCGYLYALEASLLGKNETAYNFGPIEKSLTVKEVATIASNAWGPGAKFAFDHNYTNSKLESAFLELDSSLAIRDLNWEPIWSQEEAIRLTVSWWRRLILEKHQINELMSEDLLIPLQRFVARSY
jgi:CDP-glucose 4,6-dehydratase